MSEWPPIINRQSRDQQLSNTSPYYGSGPPTQRGTENFTSVNSRPFTSSSVAVSSTGRSGPFSPPSETLPSYGSGAYNVAQHQYNALPTRLLDSQSRCFVQQRTYDSQAPRSLPPLGASAGLATQAPSFGSGPGEPTPMATQQNWGAAESSKQRRDSNLLDKSYKPAKKSRTYFVVGRVFHMLWSEPASTLSANTSGSEWSMTSFGEWVYSKPRRFVVVKADWRSCLVVPITTYNSQGVAKEHVKKGDHCVVYSGRRCPEIKSDEFGMQPFAIRVDPDDKIDKLDPKSRIDFGKPRTIDHWNKIKNYGMVNAASLEALVAQFQNVIYPSSTGTIAPTPSAVVLKSPSEIDRLVYSSLLSAGWTPSSAAKYVNRKSQGEEMSDISEHSDAAIDSGED